MTTNELEAKEMAPHSSTLAWRIPWREEPGRLQSMGSQRVRHDWATSLSLSLSLPPLYRWEDWHFKSFWQISEVLTCPHLNHSVPMEAELPWPTGVGKITLHRTLGNQSQCILPYYLERWHCCSLVGKSHHGTVGHVLSHFPELPHRNSMKWKQEKD